MRSRTTYLSRAPEFTPDFSWGLCCSSFYVSVLRVFVFSFLFVCLRPMSCVPNLASFSGLSILDGPLGFRGFVFSVPSQESENIYGCVLGVLICTSLCDVFIGFCNCSDSVVFLFFC